MSRVLYSALYTDLHQHCLTFHQFDGNDAQVVYDISLNELFYGFNCRVWKANLMRYQVVGTSLLLGWLLQSALPGNYWITCLCLAYLSLAVTLYAAMLRASIKFRDRNKSIRTMESMVEFWRRHHNRGTGCLWVVRCDHQVIGTIGYIEGKEETADLVKFYIFPQYRGRKYGSCMLQHVLDILTTKHYQKVTLDTPQTQTAAIAMYKKFGFCIDQVETYYYFFILGIFPLVVMSKKL